MGWLPLRLRIWKLLLSRKMNFHGVDSDPLWLQILMECNQGTDQFMVLSH